MIAVLNPRDYPRESASYLLTVKLKIHQLIYALIRHVDDIEENYVSLAYTLFIGILAKGWGEGFGWSKTADGGWRWSNRDYDSDKNDSDRVPDPKKLWSHLDQFNQLSFAISNMKVAEVRWFVLRGTLHSGQDTPIR